MRKIQALQIEVCPCEVCDPPVSEVSQGPGKGK